MKTHLLPALLISVLTACSTPAEKAANNLAKRIVPQYSGNISFCEVQCDSSFYSIEPIGHGITIKGSGANELAAGLGRYLEEAGIDVSWYAVHKINTPAQMPIPDSTITAKLVLKDRFFLNYCTYGYSMPWWQWEDWERLIDWMALHGVNMPLANTGQEAVLQQLWKQQGLSDEEIMEWFTGPAHLPWHRMCNIDGVDGPLSQNWIDGQVKLQKQILKRERELGMTPVLPAFAGHVPKQIISNNVTQITHWGGFQKDNLPYFLSPQDSLFQQLQEQYLTIQDKLYGTDHIYGFDLFNEVDSPSWDPETLAKIARTAYASVANHDEDARWIQMGWMFHYDRKHWTKENIKAYLTAIPEGKTTILDYYTEHTPVWTITDSFYGQPFIFCYLGNFGGNTRFAGPFRKESERIGLALPHADGIGCTLEGFGLNRWMYEYVLSRAWETGVPDNRWLEKLDKRRNAPGGFSKEMADSIYVRGSFSEGPLPCGRPCLEGYVGWRVIHTTPYAHSTLMRLWGEIINSDASTENKISIGTQALGNLFEDYRDAFAGAVRSGDLPLACNRAAAMQDLLADIDSLAACEPTLRLDRWLEDAARWGAEANARHIITTWGYNTRNLNDYASRLWAGLTGSYYARRWKIFTDAVLSNKDYEEEIDAFEQRWVRGEEPISTPPAQDAQLISERLFKKYSPKTLKLMTYNVGSFSKHQGLGLKEVTDIIKEADVVSLNELDSCNRRHGEYQLKDIADALGRNFKFTSAFPFAGGSYGNGVISKADIVASYQIPLPQMDGLEPRSVAVVETEECVFASTHLDVASKTASASQASMINAWFQEHYPCSLKPVFLSGDMNSIPESETIKELEKCWENLSGTFFTSPSHAPRKCIDYIFHLNSSAPVTVQSAQVIVPDPDPSDHLPVAVEVFF